MVQKLKSATNATMAILLAYKPMSVGVVNTVTTEERIFAGWDGLEELFDEFFNSFSEITTFDEAVKYFTPNIKTPVVNGN